MSAYSEFFLSSAPNIVQLELLEISHPDFSQIYRFVRNSTLDVEVTHEGPAGPFTYTYQPLGIKRLGSSGDLDQEIEVTLGDLGTLLPQELDLVSLNNGFEIKPVVVYRSYRSDDLAQPLFGPATLEVDGITFNREGSVFRGRAASFNLARTGITYRVARFPMLEPLA